MANALTPEQIERFQRLAWPLLPVLLRTARYLARHEQQAEDLVQDAMLKAARAIDSFRDGTDMKAWLLTILRRTHIDLLRATQQRGREVSLEQVDVDEGLVAEEPTALAAQQQALWADPAGMLERFADSEIIAALKELPEDIRWTLLLVDVEQMNHADAALVLDTPVGTIKSRTHRGRQMLRKRLEEWALEHGYEARGER